MSEWESGSVESGSVESGPVEEWKKDSERNSPNTDTSRGLLVLPSNFEN